MIYDFDLAGYKSGVLYITDPASSSHRPFGDGNLHTKDKPSWNAAIAISTLEPVLHNLRPLSSRGQTPLLLHIEAKPSWNAATALYTLKPALHNLRSLASTDLY